MSAFFILSPVIKSELSCVTEMIKEGDNQRAAEALESLSDILSVAKLIRVYSLTAIITDIKKTVDFITRKKILDANALVSCAEIIDSVSGSISFLQSHYDYKDSVFANDSKELVKMRGGSIKKSGYFLLNSSQIKRLEQIPDGVELRDSSLSATEAAAYALSKVELLYAGLEKTQNESNIKELHKTLSGLKKFASSSIEYNYYWLIQVLLETVNNSSVEDNDYLLSIIRLKNVLTDLVHGKSAFKISDINNVLSIIIFRKNLSKGLLKYADFYGITDDFLKQHKQVQQGSKTFVARHLGVIDAVKEEIGVISLISKKGNLDKAKDRVDSLRKIFSMTGYDDEARMLETSLLTGENGWVDCVLSIEKSFIRTGKPSIYIGSKFVDQVTAEKLLTEIESEVNKLRLASKKLTLTHEKTVKSLFAIERVATTSLLLAIQSQANDLLEYSTKCDYQVNSDIYMMIEGIVCLHAIIEKQRLGINPISTVQSSILKVHSYFDDLKVINSTDHKLSEYDATGTLDLQESIPFKQLGEGIRNCDYLLGFNNDQEVKEIRNQLENSLLQNPCNYEQSTEDRATLEKLGLLYKKVLADDLLAEKESIVEIECPINDIEFYAVAKKETKQRLGAIKEACAVGLLNKDGHRAFHSLRAVLRHLTYSTSADDLGYFEDLILEKGSVKLTDLMNTELLKVCEAITNTVELKQTQQVMESVIRTSILVFKEELEPVPKIEPNTSKGSEASFTSKKESLAEVRSNEDLNNVDFVSYFSESSSITPRLNSISRNLTLTNLSKEILEEISRGFHTLKGAANMLNIPVIGGVLHLVEDYFDVLKLNIIPIDECAIYTIQSAIKFLLDSDSELKQNLSLVVNAERLSEIKSQLINEDYSVTFDSLISNLSKPDDSLNTLPISVSGALGILSKSRKRNILKSIDTSEFIKLPIPDVRKLMSLTTVSRTNSFQSLSDQTKAQATNIKRGMAGLSSYLDEFRELLKETTIISSKEKYNAQDLAQYSSAEDLLSRMDSIIANVNGYGENLISTGADITANGRSIHSKLESAKRIVFEAAQVPFSTIKEQMHNLVLDTVKRTGCKATLTFKNETDLIEKSLLLEMVPVISHMIRNSIDHGMETGVERLSSGKPEVGNITIGINIKNSFLQFYISDNGKGMEPSSIFKRAVSKGIIRGDQALNDEQKLNLIFSPGFSTVDKVSEVSGRGVGMNVVKEFVDSKKGSIGITSKTGKGTRFNLELPLSSQSSNVFVCGIGGLKIGIPKNMLQGHIKVKQNSDVITVKDLHYPVVKLSDLIGMPTIVAKDAVLSSVLIIKSESGAFGIAFEQSFGMQDVYIKPLTSVVTGVNGVADYNDKEVLSIINPDTLFKKHMEHDGTSYRVLEKYIRENPSEFTLTALVVDDSALMRNELSKMLALNDYETICATDGVDALNLLDNSGYKFNIITLDIEMPNLNGMSLLKRLKASPATQNIPVVMISSRASKTHMDRAKEMGASEFLVKPVSQSQLDHVVSRYRS